MFITKFVLVLATLFMIFKVCKHVHYLFKDEYDHKPDMGFFYEELILISFAVAGVFISWGDTLR